MIRHTVTIRRAMPTDAPALTALAHRSKASWGYPNEWLLAWQPDLTMTPDYVSVHRTFVAELAGRPVGVVALEEHPDRWTLEHLWVEPGLQRHGIGRNLVAHALGVARELRPAPVHVVSDPFAESFYERLGAVRVGARPAPMPGAPDRILPVLVFPVPAPPVQTS
jgi:GNAT superfamily N-acetyltransferase